MPIIATDTLRFSNTFKHEYEPALGFCRESLTVNEVAGATFPIGTVLGKVTATGKFKRVEATAVDGSQVAVAVTMEDAAVVAATDKKILCAVRGPVLVADGALSFGASVTAGALRTAALGQLAAVNGGILANVQI